MDNLRFEKVEIAEQPLFPFIDCIYQDSRGLMWFGTYGGLFMYDGYQVTHFSNDPDDSLSIGDNKIRSLLEDQNGDLWIGTQVAFFFFDSRSRTFEQLDISPEGGLGNVTVDYLVEAEDGDIWVGSSLGLFKASLKTHILQKVKYKEELNRLKVMALTMSKEGDLFLADQFEIYRKKHDTKDFEKIVSKEEMPQEIAIGIHLDHEGYLWIVRGSGVYKYDTRNDTMLLFQDLGLKHVARAIIIDDEMILADKGLLRLNLKTLEYKIQPVDLNDPDNELKNRVSSIYHSHEDHIWIGTGLNAAFRCDLRRKAFQHIPVNLSLPRLSSEIYEYEPGIFLVPQSDGLFFLNRSTGERKPFPYRPSTNISDWESGVITFYEENHLLWMGTMSGLFLFNKKTERFEDFEQNNEGTEALHGLPIRDILRSKDGNLWIARWVFGVFTFDFKENRLIKCKFPSPPIFGDNPASRHLYEDREGQIWIGTRVGLIKYLEERDSFIVYQHDPNDRESMSENTSFCIYQDSLGYIWSGSYGGGLNRLDPATGKFRHFTTNQGLLDNNILSLLPDKSGNLWMMSFTGVSRFNPYTFAVDNFTSDNGLGSIAYDAFAYGKSPYSGEFFFGGVQGIDIIHPDSIKISDLVPRIIFTDFQLFNESVGIRKVPDEDNSIFCLDQHISWTKHITLTYDQKVFSFQYAALDFSGPQLVQYAYQLEGFDDDWQFVDKRRNVTYTNLSPGQYTFKVKSTNADGVWNPTFASMLIVITPPWWATWWAYLAYLIIFVSLVYTVYFYQRRRWALKMALQFQQQEALRLKDLDTIKTNLYTNITHEFRTPLTIILGLADQLQEKVIESGKEGLQMIRRNGSHLLNLVNQMLDLQKLEAGAMPIHLIRGDIQLYLKYLVESFHSYADSKNIDLQFSANPESLIIDYDPEKIQDIVSNLISNALKFTPKNGTIHIECRSEENDQFKIAVRDNGVGISPEKLPHIFERFYQADDSSVRHAEGTGVGLALTKELVSLLGGQISVNSILGAGSEFMVTLPIRQTAQTGTASIPEKPYVHINAGEISIAQALDSEQTQDLPQILVIEDNLDVIQYISSILQNDYQIKTSADGHKGVENALEFIPDLIISDVMMPRMDGYQVCDTLKQDPKTSHIPIILLTAKADLDSKLEGLQYGADAYLTKPFNKQELVVRIRSMLEQRRRLQSHYQELYGILDLNTMEEAGMAVSKPESQFIQNVRAAIHDHLDDTTFGVDQLCQNLAMSNSQLYRKLKAHTGLSAHDLIQSIRLSNAKSLLTRTDDTISEIAYQCGFNDPEYFSRVFKKEVGFSPSEFRNQ